MVRVVIVPAAGDAPPLDYAVADALRDRVAPGARVVVPLGARRAVGVVTETLATSAQPQLKSVLAVLDERPLVDASLLRLCHWVAEYYLCSLAEAVSTALPGTLRVAIERRVRLARMAGEAGEDPVPLTAREQALVEWLQANDGCLVQATRQQFGPTAPRCLVSLQRKGLVQIEERSGTESLTRHVRHYRVARRLDVNEAAIWGHRRPAQFAVYAYLHDHPLGRASLAELAATFANAAPKLAALVQAGLLVIDREEVYRPVLPDTPPADRPVELSAAQDEAVRAIRQQLEAGFRPMLLWGVTGSGKTEVYLRSIAACRDAGRTALVLVPEISLTHQVVDRIRARFGERVAVLHSALSDGERWDEWRRIARGEVDIVVGARSAVFAPLQRLGLVVVDEEHDPAYKQEDGVRYNGRDVAVMRGKLLDCPVVLGSATPAMETFHNARIGRYTLLELPERVEARPLPSVEIVDLRRRRDGGRAMLLTAPLVAALKANLAARGQSLIFLNRRGFASFLQCHQCGEPLMCPNCSVTLTLHRKWRALRCHHCDHTVPVPVACPGCGGLSLAAWGAGTEQVESVVHALVPGARVVRVDRDTTRRKGAMRRVLEAWGRQAYDVMVGTQMVTKGHDVHGVTLVGVVLADLSLNFPDFRAAERTFQLLTQVAGRAGRGERPGRVIVQTLQPEHASLLCAQHHDYHRFVDEELAGRRELGYPPFTRLVHIRCDGGDKAGTERIAREIAETVRRSAAPGLGVLGPAPAPLERLRGRFRWQVLLRHRQGAAARAAARRGRDAVRRAARAAGVRVVLDVDPYDML
jgi:primosomal protein N' (replication factor Y)